jgi:hypothetical protein
MTYSDDAIYAGQQAGYAHGHALSRRDVEDIVWAVNRHDAELAGITQVVSQFHLDEARADILEHVRMDMRRKLAIEVLEKDSVMLDLPTMTLIEREPTFYGDIEVRLSVPVRRIDGREATEV